jgi:hypothetical protein
MGVIGSVRASPSPFPSVSIGVQISPP